MSTREIEDHLHCDRCGSVVTEGIAAVLGDRELILCNNDRGDHADALHKQGWTVVTIQAVA